MQSLLARRSSKQKEDFVEMIIGQIGALTFAYDWEKRGGQPGGRLYKASFVALVFNRLPQHSALNAKGTNAKRILHRKTFKQFQTRHGRDITARNTLRSMYKLYGPAIFMDGGWDAEAMVHQTNTFRVLLTRLTQNVNSPMVTRTQTHFGLLLIG